MEFFTELDSLPGTWENPVLAIGVFDGMHLGHQDILKKISTRARELKGTAILLSFHPHPQKIISPGDAPPLLQTTEQRIEMLENLGIDCFVRLPFDRWMSLLSPEQFGEQILTKFAPAEVHVGENFKFGQGRSGSYESLTRLGENQGFRLLTTKTRVFRNRRISSTWVRRAIKSGRVELAGRLLGRPYEIEGMVVKGAGKGSTLGYPTVNLEASNELIPPSGVYVTRVLTEKGRFQGATNIGFCPTVKKNPDIGPSIETHLIGFEDNLYGQKIKISFCLRLRNEQHFESLKALTDQIERDLARARSYLLKTKHLIKEEYKSR